MTQAHDAHAATPPSTTSAAMVKAKPASPQLLLKQDLERASTALAAMLPRHVTVERLIKVVLSATARDAKLLECTRASIVRAVMQSAELGLELGGVLGEAYLVPFKRSWKDDKGKWKSEKQAQCVPGYRGLIKLARQGGVVAVHAHPVHERDGFKVDMAEQRIEHTPDMSDEPGPLVAVYAIARLPSGDRQIEVMRRAEVEAIRRRSKTYNAESDTNDGPWSTDYEEMARKTAVRRLAKYLPLSHELARALEHEAELEDKGAHRAAALDVLDAHLLAEEPRPRALALAEEIASKDATIAREGAGEGAPSSAGGVEEREPPDPPTPIVIEEAWEGGDWATGWHGAPAPDAFKGAAVLFRDHVRPADRAAAATALKGQRARLAELGAARVDVKEVLAEAGGAPHEPNGGPTPRKDDGTLSYEEQTRLEQADEEARAKRRTSSADVAP